MSSSSAAGNSMRPLDGVVPADHALLRHANADRAVVLVCLPLRHETAGLGLAALDPIELEARVAVPLDPEPAQGALDLLHRVGDLPARVGVLDPQQALASVPAGDRAS